MSSKPKSTATASFGCHRADEIPLADDDNTEEVTDADIMKLSLGTITHDRLNDIRAAATVTTANTNNNGLDLLINNSAPNDLTNSANAIVDFNTHPCSLEIDVNQDEAEEKEQLIRQVLELQNTLDDLSLRVDSVNEENLKLKSENQVLSQYIENLMSASSVFQSTSPKSNPNKTTNAIPAAVSTTTTNNNNSLRN